MLCSRLNTFTTEDTKGHKGTPQRKIGKTITGITRVFLCVFLRVLCGSFLRFNVCRVSLCVRSSQLPFLRRHLAPQNLQVSRNARVLRILMQSASKPAIRRWEIAAYAMPSGVHRPKNRLRLGIPARRSGLQAALGFRAVLRCAFCAVKVAFARRLEISVWQNLRGERCRLSFGRGLRRWSAGCFLWTRRRHAWRRCCFRFFCGFLRRRFG